MVDVNFDRFIGANSTPLYVESSGEKTKGFLLWGDGVHLLGQQEGGRLPVRARGRERNGWIDAEALEGGKSLLEVYFIDVGQGDGMLIKTPDFRHIMIDGGHPRGSQNTGKSAADFVDWKFFEDYGLDHVRLDAMISSHNDFDHYGGLADLLDAEQEDELDVAGTTVEAFYHAGISWWTKPDGSDRTLGETERENGRTFHVDLLDDRGSAEHGIDPASRPKLQGAWGNFIAKVVSTRRADGEPTPVTRLSDRSEYLPTFGPGSDVRIHILGPVEFSVGERPGLLKLGADSRTTNGNSVLARLDYGRARILLTGDLNKASQQALLDAYEGRRLEFQCDVAKACHHGSEDVSYTFLQAIKPAVTVISSGDAEGHDHPKPRIVAASGATGYLTIEEDEIVTPLVYSTELARSISLGHPRTLEIDRQITGTPENLQVDPEQLQNVTITYHETKPGGLRPAEKSKRLSQIRLVGGLIYGLVNVRTDGDKILTATMNEGDGSWTVKTFRSRF
ncbi:ComEC/Rec2 family competence protein [Mesorhizobium ventifaucium]|uniref:Metallo-beta-lactamase superfamily protein n=1 Tax=Mesorhizobium ventifaucium TaxID=666020 RepID=A0ABN8K7Z2_9HYPH|nr:MBL fold metallo-hydrolase [Mesorhizobium ventifaucium]CAH2405640.1 Metallo-beta-lactamase superfamily protein [Mesorhizobium ventifaucium]